MDQSPSTPPISPAIPEKDFSSKRKSALVISLIIVAAALIIGGTFGGYIYGKNQVKPQPSDSKQPVTELSVPQGATVIAQCVEKRGTQYISPTDIPYGPIYDVHNGKVIGVEFMVEKAQLDSLTNDVRRFDLPEGQFKHVMMGNEPHGHAGLAADHYHIDFMLITPEESDAITCGETPSSAGHAHNM